MTQRGAPQINVVEHPSVYCPHCGASQTKSLLLTQAPAPPTICLSCKGPVRLTGPLWMDKMSELEPDAAIVPTLRVVLAQFEAQHARAQQQGRPS